MNLVEYRRLVAQLEHSAASRGQMVSDLQRVKLYLAVRFRNSPTCPACQAKRWDFAGVVNAQPAAFEEQLAGNVVQFAVIICRSCFYSMQFAWPAIERGELPPEWQGVTGGGQAEI